MLDRLIEQIRQERHDSQAEADGGPRAHPNVLDILERPSRVLDDGVDSESGQSHGGDGLEDGTLDHDGLVVLERGGGEQCDGVALQVRGRRARVLARVGLVALVGHVAGQVQPRDSVRATDQPRMHHRPERLADVGRVRYVAVRRAQDRTRAVGVRSVPHVGFGRVWSAAVGGQLGNFTGARGDEVDLRPVGDVLQERFIVRL